MRSRNFSHLNKHIFDDRGFTVSSLLTRCFTAVSGPFGTYFDLKHDVLYLNWSTLNLDQDHFWFDVTLGEMNDKDSMARVENLAVLSHEDLRDEDDPNLRASCEEWLAHVVVHFLGLKNLMIVMDDYNHLSSHEKHLLQGSALLTSYIFIIYSVGGNHPSSRSSALFLHFLPNFISVQDKPKHNNNIAPNNVNVQPVPIESRSS